MPRLPIARASAATASRTLLFGAGAALAAVALAACSSSSTPSAGTTSGSGSPAKSTGSSGGSSAPGTEFSPASVAGLGTVVVDGRGRTVYVLTSGSQKNVPCNDANGCTKYWPDLPLPAGTAAAKAGSGIDASMLGATKLSDGETYPTYNGWLMYEFSGDTAAGQAKGQLVQSFGGTWEVLGASGNPITTAASSSGGSGGSGGY